MKDREVRYQKFVFNSSENRSKLELLLRNAFADSSSRLLFSLLIFRLTEQFGVVSVSEIEKT